MMMVTSERVLKAKCRISLYLGTSSLKKWTVSGIECRDQPDYLFSSQQLEGRIIPATLLGNQCPDQGPIMHPASSLPRAVSICGLTRVRWRRGKAKLPIYYTMYPHPFYCCKRSRTRIIPQVGYWQVLCLQESHIQLALLKDHSPYIYAHVC